jgi:dTMP kinase
MTAPLAPSPGRLIVLEGTEGAGKTTQAAHLADALREVGVATVIVREPGATWLGEKIRGLLLDAHVDIEARAEVFLFLAARAQLVPDVRDHLRAGTTVIADRFFLSTYAYQVMGRGLPAPLVTAANALAVGDLVPDLTLLLAVPAPDGLARKRSAGTWRDRIESAGVDFHERVGAAFGAAATAEWQLAHPECGPIVRIDATGSEATVGEQVRAAVAARWPGILDVRA